MSDIDGLIQRWQAGDEQAAEAIYNHYRGITYGLAFTLLADAADAEEVTQDSLTYALTHISNYDSKKARFATWLHTITVSRCRNKRRRRLLPSLSLFGWLRRGGDAPDSTPGPERQAIQSIIRDEVWVALHTLSQPLREAILLRHWADYTYQEIGQMLGCSARVARSRVLKAHETLEPLLAEHGLTGLEEEIR
jgi:RNA polymerase sigma-70 factor (ECF subfamily)